MDGNRNRSMQYACRDNLHVFDKLILALTTIHDKNILTVVLAQRGKRSFKKKFKCDFQLKKKCSQALQNTSFISFNGPYRLHRRTITTRAEMNPSDVKARANLLQHRQHFVEQRFHKKIVDRVACTMVFCTMGWTLKR